MQCRNKLQLDYEDLIQSDLLEKQIAAIRTSVEELEAWHTRTSNRQNRLAMRGIHSFVLFLRLSIGELTSFFFDRFRFRNK